MKQKNVDDNKMQCTVALLQTRTNVRNTHHP